MPDVLDSLIGSSRLERPDALLTGIAAWRVSRRRMISCLAAFTLGAETISVAAAKVQQWTYPIAFPGELPGWGLFVKHGYACEHAAYYPGLWHTGENWYGIERNAIEAEVIAAADGEVVYADFDYPGRVVIVRHAESLFSMYGHLDYQHSVSVGQQIGRGERIGSPLSFPDGIERTHLHFEIRTFYTSDLINGDRPSHGFTCGFQCPPGPGYWPIDAEDHPSELGWLNPTHVIQNRLFDGKPPIGAEIVATSDKSYELWSEPSNHADAVPVGNMVSRSGGRYPLVDIATGTEASTATSAIGYRVWYRIESSSEGVVWVEGLHASDDNIGNDGRPSAVLLDFIPALP